MTLHLIVHLPFQELGGLLARRKCVYLAVWFSQIWCHGPWGCFGQLKFGAGQAFVGAGRVWMMFDHFGVAFSQAWGAPGESPAEFGQIANRGAVLCLVSRVGSKICRALMAKGSPPFATLPTRPSRAGHGAGRARRGAAGASAAKDANLLNQDVSRPGAPVPKDAVARWGGGFDPLNRRWASDWGCWGPTGWEWGRTPIHKFA